MGAIRAAQDGGVARRAERSVAAPGLRRDCLAGARRARTIQASIAEARSLGGTADDKRAAKAR